MPQAVENILRLLLAALLGALVGVERERNEQPAGLRTNLLVALGACLFTLMSVYGIDAVSGEVDTPTRFDPSRVVSQVVVGIGFLGAGAILKQGLSIRGLTTAASLWVVAAIGTATGLGSYDLALAATVIAIGALYGLRPARGWVRRLGSDREEILVRGTPELDIEGILGAVRSAGGRDVGIEISVEDDGTRSVSVEARFPGAATVDRAVDEIAAQRGVQNVGPPTGRS